MSNFVLSWICECGSYLASNAVVSSSLFIVTTAYLTLYLKSMRPRLEVEELWIYPIKSCRGIKVDRAGVTVRGFFLDREFMVVDASNKFISQRSHPKLALIDTAIEYEHDAIFLDAVGMPTLKIPLTVARSAKQTSVEVNVWGDLCQAVEINDECNAWFQTFLDNGSLKLVRMAENFTRKTDEAFAPYGQCAFSDGFPFLLLSTESLQDLNSRLEQPVSMERFRPNIVVGGLGKAYCEDDWATIHFFPDLKMSIAKPCSRCTIPTLDINTASFDESREPLKTLRTYRTGAALGYSDPRWRGDVFFGQNLDHSSLASGVIRVGDPVVVTMAHPARWSSSYDESTFTNSLVGTQGTAPASALPQQ